MPVEEGAKEGGGQAHGTVAEDEAEGTCYSVYGNLEAERIRVKMVDVSGVDRLLVLGMTA